MTNDDRENERIDEEKEETLLLTMKSGPTYEQVVDVVAQFYGVSKTSILRAKKKGRMPFYEKMTIYLTHRMTTLSLAELERVFGRKLRTIIKAFQDVEALSKDNGEMKKMMQEIVWEINREN